MTELVRSVILGIVQGLTEFLPVSSSGHLEIGKFLFGDTASAEESLFFTIMVHVATALSTVFVFRKDIWAILKGAIARPWNESQRFILNVVISMIPAAMVGFFAEPLVESLFTQRIALVGAMLIATAILLLLADRAKTTHKGVTPLNALIVGLAQAVAILPGISRSGATISTSVLLGIDRYEASRFSFLMVVPLILGKIAYDLMGDEILISDGQLLSVSAGFIAAFISGVLACKWMIKLVATSRLWYFSIYCAVVGIIAIILA